MEAILKIYNTLVLPIYLYRSENWTLTALQRRRTETAEIKLSRPPAGYTLHDHKTNDHIRRELDNRHTRQDRRIQTELASTLAKNATKRIPLKSYQHRPQRRKTVRRPKKRWREQL